jgi:hypothetical protein
MRDAIPVYDAVCCRTWIMPAETFAYAPGRCGFCGDVPTPTGNVRSLPITTPPQYLLPNFKEHHG